MNIKGIKNVFKNNKKIIAISLSATIVSGNLIGIVIGNAICENRKNSDRDKLFSEYSQSEFVEISDDPKTEYLNIFDIQMDETKIVKMSDKNGFDITNYVKNCSITKTEESKIYLDNGYIIYYDNDGFKYIKGDIYKEEVDHTKTKLITNVIAYVNKYTKQVIGYNNCKNMYDSVVDYEKIVDELLNDDNFINLYKKRYPDDEGFSRIDSSSCCCINDVSKHYDDEVYNDLEYYVIGIFRFFDGKEDEFEKTFGFPMYVTNKDGLMVYNIYKLANVYQVDSSYSFSDYLFNNYNIYYDMVREKSNFTDENREVFIKKIKEALNQSSSVCIDLDTWIDIEGEDGSYERKTLFKIYDSYIDDITDDGDLMLINNDNSKIIIKYGDLVKNNQHYSVSINVNKIRQSSSIGIFDEYNIVSNQYGGDQDAFKSPFNSTKYALEDPIIVENLRQYYPDATMEDYELYLNKLCRFGCGYVALVNTVFKEYEARPDEFEEKFGFPIYEFKLGKLDFNYEYLILDFYNYVWSNSGYTIQEICGDIETGMTLSQGTQFFLDFLREKYGLDFTYSKTVYIFDTDLNGSINDEIRSKYIQLKNINNYVIVSAVGFDLYDIYGKLCNENVGAHGMYVTGLTEDGKLIVSSGGNRYVLDCSDFGIAEYEIDGSKIDKHAWIQSLQYK